MPWTASDAKKHKKGLTPAQAATWAKIANRVLRACQKSGGSDCEGKAIRQANSKFEEPVMSEETFDWKAHDEHFGVTEDRKKPGGSNVGKYKKGPFCGPAGGAPKGTYPVNTRARGIAAISYSRHAPNPSGIKACVCRHWPGLDACKKEKKKEKQSMNEDYLKRKFDNLISSLRKQHPGFEDWEYLIHHIHKDPKTGKEEVHHCSIVDHLGNLYEMGHVKDSKGKFRHCLIGLHEDQKVYWSDEEAEADGKEIPCANRQL